MCRASGGPPTTSPSWYTQNDRSRWAVIEGSFWRRLPAAALRGLTNSRPPAASACSFIRSKLATGRYTSPRTSSTSGTTTPLGGRQPARHGADRRHVGRDVLADPAVAPRRRLHVAAALVADAHRHAVDLQLAHVAHGLVRAGRGRSAGPTPPAPRRSSRCRGSASARSARPARTARSARRRRPGPASRRRPARGARPRAGAARGPAGRSRRRRSPGRRARGSGGCGRRRARSARRCARRCPVRAGASMSLRHVGHDAEARRRGRSGWRRPAR